MKKRVIFALVVLALVLLATAFAQAQPGFGIGLMTPLKDGPGWTATSIELSWSMKLTKQPSWGIWASGFGIPEAGNGQVGISLSGNLGEVAQRSGLRLSDEFQAVLDASYIGPAIATDKLDFNDWSHWAAGVTFRYIVPVRF